MNKDEIIQLIQEQIAADKNSGLFNVTKVPYHIHNNLDAPKLTFLGQADVPSSYEGQAGNVATVNTSETGLTFTSGGGAAAITVKDGATTVNSVTTVDFTGGAVVTAGAAGTADVSITAASVAGLNTEIQYNDNGNFGADATLTYDVGGLLMTIGAENDNSAIVAPDASTNNTDGGTIKIKGGTGLGSGAGGDSDVYGGTGGVTGSGGTANLLAGDAGGTSGVGGDVNLVAGNGGSVSGNAGGVFLRPGSAAGSGSYGMVQVATPPGATLSKRSYFELWDTGNVGIRRFIGYTITLDATPTGVTIVTVPDNTAGYVEARVVGYLSGNAKFSTMAFYQQGFARDTTLSLIGTVAYSFFVTNGGAACNADFTTSGNDLQIRLTGFNATTYDWAYEVTYMALPYIVT